MSAAPPSDGTARSVLRGLVLPVYLPSLLAAVGQTAIAPVIPLIALRLGYSVSAAAAITLITGLVGVLGPIPAARLMGRVGERPAMIGTGVGLAAANLAGYALLEHAGTPSPGHRAAFAGVLLVMAVTGQVWSLGRQSYLGSELPARFRARGMSTFGGMMRIGAIIGPALGAMVIGFGHLAWVYLLDTVAIATATALVTFCMVPRHGRLPSHGSHVDEAIDPREPAPLAPGRPALATMLLGALGTLPLTIGRTARTSVLPLAGAAWGVSDSAISLVFAVAAAVEIALFAPAGTLMDRRGRAAVAVPCVTIMGLAYLGLGLAGVLGTGPLGPVAVLAAAAVVMAIGNGMGAGIQMTLGVDFSPEHARTRHLARWQAIQGAGSLLSPLLVSGVTLVAPVATAGLLTGTLCVAGGAWLARFLPTATPAPGRR